MQARPARSSDGPCLRRSLVLSDLLVLGIAAIFGAKGTVLVWGVKEKLAGPGVILSSAIALVVAILTALVFSEFGAEYSLTGGSFVYCVQVFGYPAAWIIGVNLAVEFIFTTAAIAKSFTANLLFLFGQPVSTVRVEIASGWSLDFLALALVALYTCLLLYDGQVGLRSNWLTVSVTSVLVLFVIGYGFTQVQPEHYIPFTPHGVSSMLEGAAIIFFAFLGYDVVTLAAEESKDPRVLVPRAVMISTLVCGVLYLLLSVMAAGLQVDLGKESEAPLAAALNVNVNWWSGRLAALGMLCAVADTQVAFLYGVARQAMVLSRYKLLPAFLSKVHPVYHTPWNAQITLGIVEGLLASFFTTDSLSRLTAMSTIFVYFVVCLACLWRRYHVPGGSNSWKKLTPLFIGISVSGCAGGGLYRMDRTVWPLYTTFIGVWVVCTAGLYRFPQLYVPSRWAVPCFPLLPSLAVGLCGMLMGAMPQDVWLQWGLCTISGLTLFSTYKLVVRTPWRTWHRCNAEWHDVYQLDSAFGNDTGPLDPDLEGIGVALATAQFLSEQEGGDGKWKMAVVREDETSEAGREKKEARVFGEGRAKGHEAGMGPWNAQVARSRQDGDAADKTLQMHVVSKMRERAKGDAADKTLQMHVVSKMRERAKGDAAHSSPEYADRSQSAAGGSRSRGADTHQTGGVRPLVSYGEIEEGRDSPTCT